jgi:SAM-dependent methyltransferase
MITPYDTKFFSDREGAALQSARAVAPLIRRVTGADSVVDVGCGTGAWVLALEEAGVQDTFGVDGAWLDPAGLLFDPARFASVDLTARFALERRFDVALCLEVAEHLPPDAALPFIRNLTALAPLVVFSAAVPHQGGTGHLNEQWPSYWIGQFAACGYRAVDCFRPELWSDDRVAFWYAQNMFLFVSREVTTNAANVASPWLPTDAAHPRMVAHLDEIRRQREEELHPRSLPLRALLTALPGAGLRAIMSQLRRR